MTRDHLASAVGVSRQAVDGWLDAGARPKDEHLALIAKALSGTNGDDAERLEAELRRGYFLQELAAKLASAVSRGTTEFFTTSLAVLVNWLVPLFSRLAVRRANGIASEDDQNRSVQWARRLAVLGSSAPIAGPLLRAMADSQGDKDWKLAIQGAQTPWLGYLQMQHVQLV
ncbi:MAG: helix-turn-helix transcriptional regulator [Chloroflexi bacterium]|nr:helix-turn-helix transcriptional regulator [Chloroflexota bacterium]